MKKLLYYSLPITLIVAAYFTYNWANKNYTGYCREAGRSLTEQEMKTHMRSAFSKYDGIQVGGGDLHQLIIGNKRYKLENGKSIYVPIKKYKMHGFDGRSKLKIHLYPNVPAYALDGKGRLVPYHGSTYNIPVTNYYKYTGYAKSLYFMDVKLYIETISDPIVPLYIDFDWRGWVNNCGKTVPIPDEYF